MDGAGLFCRGMAATGPEYNVLAKTPGAVRAEMPTDVVVAVDDKTRRHVKTRRGKARHDVQYKTRHDKNKK